jgi:hypothetical protein
VEAASLPNKVLAVRLAVIHAAYGIRHQRVTRALMVRPGAHVEAHGLVVADDEAFAVVVRDAP